MTVDGMQHFILNFVRCRRAAYLREVVNACGESARGDRQLLGDFHEHSQILLAEKVSAAFCIAFDRARKYDLELAYDTLADGGPIAGYFARRRGTDCACRECSVR